MKGGMYVHIPYCKQACTYCDFYFSTGISSAPDTLHTLKKEIQLRASEAHDLSLATLYFGGGTPSHIEPVEIRSIIDTVRENYALETDAEITLESNPDDIDEHRLKEWMAAGVNRLSIGVQTFHEEELRIMNRAHHAAQSESAIKRAQDAGIENITIDLIYGTPWKRTRDLEYDLKKVIALKVPHVSAYQLTQEEKTKLHHWVEKREVKMLCDDEVAEQFHLLQEALSESGILQYEVSNFAKPGWESKHNSSYWKGLPYLGIGPSAHSYDGIHRRWNVANLHVYNRELGESNDWFEQEELSEIDRYNELVLTCLRMRIGLKLSDLTALPESYTQYFLEQAEELMTHSSLELDHDHYRIPIEKVMLTDGICSSLFMTEDN